MGADPADLPTIDALRTIAEPPPRLPDDALRSVLREHYGLEGELRPLLGERDQNCVVTTSAGERFVLKIANRAEDPLVADFQVRALMHLEARGCAVATPRVVPARDGDALLRIEHGDATYLARVVSYLAGRPFTGRTLAPGAAFALGRGLAHLDAALADFAHPGDSQELLWDMQRALELRPLLRHVSNVALRDSLSRCLDDFESGVLPYLRSAGRQVIHGDLNPGNVLLSADDRALAGIIDFGDMVRAPVAVDLAIAASYLRSGGADPFALIAAATAGYASVAALAEEALAALYGMIRVRLVTSITLLHWRLQARGEGDAYSAASVASEDDSAGFLEIMNSVGPAAFHARIRAAIDR